MKSTQVQTVTEDVINQDLFGIKYNIDHAGVNIFTFTPSLILDNEVYMSNRYDKHHVGRSNVFQVYLVSPIFLPLRTSLNGLYRQCLFYLSESLKSNETISIVWLFQKRINWKDAALSMYESYLKGDSSPSEIEVVRLLKDKLYSFVQRVSSPLLSKEYSQYVENKILDEGYSFQCMIEINSERSNELSRTLQDIHLQYDFQNSMSLERVDNRYPYTLYPTNQILSKSELSSLFLQNELQLEILETTRKQVKMPFNNIEIAETLHSNWKDRVTILPKLEKKDVRIDESIVPKLADALKRIKIISQARLYNEIVQYGSRLTVIQADTPKNKNFSDIQRKQKDIQVELGVESLGIEQGNNPGTIKYTIPHNQEQAIGLREIIEREDFYVYAKNNPMAFIVGLDEIGNPIYLSLAEFPHLGVYGTTGSGKSVFLNTTITTFLITHSPDELSLILIDPKQVELQQYESFPHVQEVITDMDKAHQSLEGLVIEMERRYTLFKEENVKDIGGYNTKSEVKLPYYVCVIEEYADMYDHIGSKAEKPIKRLGQKARAAGIHLIIVTQRPSADVLSSNIKANIPNSICFNLNTNTNYRTVFGTGIPFNLMGKGDGVFQIVGYPKEFQRFQSPIITTNKIEEELIYEELAKSYSDYEKSEVIEHKGTSELDKLKRKIASTRETRVSELRKELGIKMENVIVLMNRLVDEGWLIKHKSRNKGYELVADDDELKEYID